MPMPALSIVNYRGDCEAGLRGSDLSKRNRKVTHVGTSYFVTLPRQWMEANGLRPWLDSKKRDYYLRVDELDDMLIVRLAKEPDPR